LDLHTRIVYYSDSTEPKRPQFTVLRTDILPRLGIDNGRIVNLVEYGDSAGKAGGYFRQTGEDSWSEDQQTGGRDANRFREVTRDAWAVYLADDDRDIWVQIDLLKGEIFWQNPGAEPQYLAEVLNTSAKLNGWLVNTVLVENGGAFRQAAWTRWVEDTQQDGPGAYKFVEVSRDDTMVQLHDTDRDVHVTIDLSAAITRVSERAGPTRDLYKIESALHQPEAWRMGQRITSRSALTEDYDLSAGTQAVPRPVYRCSVSLPPHVALVHFRDGARSQPSLELLRGGALATNRVRATNRQHLVQNSSAAGCLSLLGGEAACSQPRSDQCLVSAHRRFDQRALAIICCFLPSQSSSLREYLKMPVTLCE
jgi:hypothetical protein